MREFYEGRFDWRFEPEYNDRYSIRNGKSETIAAVQEVDNSIKGDKEYWSVFFGVSDVAATKAKAFAAGGRLVYDDGDTTVLADPGGAFFHLAAVV